MSHRSAISDRAKEVWLQHCTRPDGTTDWAMFERGIELVTPAVDRGAPRPEILALWHQAEREHEDER